MLYSGRISFCRVPLFGSLEGSGKKSHFDITWCSVDLDSTTISDVAVGKERNAQSITGRQCVESLRRSPRQDKTSVMGVVARACTTRVCASCP